MTDQSYLKKRCTEDLKSFNTALIKYRNDFSTNTQPKNNNLLSKSIEGTEEQEKLQESPMNIIQAPTVLHHNNNNNNKFSNYYNNRRSEGKLLSPPHSVDYSDLSLCCNSVAEGGMNRVQEAKNGTNYGQSPLIRNRFSNSSPSVFYGSTTVTNGHNNNGYYKPRYYSSGHKKDKKKLSGPANVSDIHKRVYGLMERFAARSYIFFIPSNPTDLIHCNQFDMLNRHIWEVYSNKAQKEVTYLKKLEFWKSVYLSIQQILLRYGLFLVGSTMSGLGLDRSDIDMCLLVRPGLIDPRADALTHLQSICKLLETCDFVKDPEIIMAKVPILKFRDALYGFEVDLNCNNSVGIRNTHLLNAYARLDWRVRPMVVIVKVWAQANDINDAKRMTINSYSLALMTLHYLQCGVNPPAIPCLQVLYPDRFGPNVEIHSLDLQEELPPFLSDNRQSLGELFLGFLHYFSTFNYNQFAMSVREGRVVSKDECRFVRAPKNDVTQWKLLCIEEPFDLTNTARCVYDVNTFEHIKSIFRGSYEMLVQTKDLSTIVPLHIPQINLTPSHVNHANYVNQANHASPISSPRNTQTNQR